MTLRTSPSVKAFSAMPRNSILAAISSTYVNSGVLRVLFHTAKNVCDITGPAAFVISNVNCMGIHGRGVVHY